MTAKEKAQELTEKYKTSLMLFDDDIDSKKCAFIAVQEILNALNSNMVEYCCTYRYEAHEYYTQVKQEIQKL
jgi:hypothetical protein